MASESKPVSRTAADLTHFNTLSLNTVWIRLFDPFNVAMPNAPYRVTLGTRSWEGQADGDGWLKIRYGEPTPPCLIEWGTPEPPSDMTPVGDLDLPPPDLAETAQQNLSAVLSAWLGGGNGDTGTSSPEAPEGAEPSNTEESSDPPDSSEPFGEAAQSDAGKESDSTSRYEHRLTVQLDLAAEVTGERTRRRLLNFGFIRLDDLEQNVRAFQRVYDRPMTGQADDVSTHLLPWHDDCEPDRWPALDPPSIA